MDGALRREGGTIRKLLPWLLVPALVLGAAVAASAAPNVQTITGQVKPSALPKDTRAPISLLIDVSATNPGNPFGIANPTKLAKVDFDRDGRFQQKGLPTCNPARFTPATTTAQAKNLCSSSLIGGGRATILVPLGTATPPLTIGATVTAFNASNNRTVFHTYNGLSGAQVLIGKIGPADPGIGSQYGITLTVPVPPLAGGTAVITQFSTKVKKVYRFRGRRLSVYSARCGPDRKLRVQARFTDSSDQLATATNFQACTQKSG
jgi:hypothetical protein